MAFVSIFLICFDLVSFGLVWFSCFIFVVNNVIVTVLVVYMAFIVNGSVKWMRARDGYLARLAIFVSIDELDQYWHFTVLNH